MEGSFAGRGGETAGHGEVVAAQGGRPAVTVADVGRYPVGRCPRCGEGAPLNTLSRTSRGAGDEATMICAGCGTEEAFEQLAGGPDALTARSGVTPAPSPQARPGVAGLSRQPPVQSVGSAGADAAGVPRCAATSARTAEKKLKSC